jgi:hypothetical protein
MHVPRAIGSDLDETTQLYVDLYIAVDCLHMRYQDYMAQVPAEERTLYTLYANLKALKERRAMEWAKAQAALEREAQQGGPMVYR